jgi:hypothetical protein
MSSTLFILTPREGHQLVPVSLHLALKSHILGTPPPPHNDQSASQKTEAAGPPGLTDVGMFVGCF